MLRLTSRRLFSVYRFISIQIYVGLIWDCSACDSLGCWITGIFAYHLVLDWLWLLFFCAAWTSSVRSLVHWRFGFRFVSRIHDKMTFLFWLLAALFLCDGRIDFFLMWRVLLLFYWRLVLLILLLLWLFSSHYWRMLLLTDGHVWFFCWLKADWRVLNHFEGLDVLFWCIDGLDIGTFLMYSDGLDVGWLFF